jgi:hypothetical protein
LPHLIKSLLNRPEIEPGWKLFGGCAHLAIRRSSRIVEPSFI